MGRLQRMAQIVRQLRANAGSRTRRNGKQIMKKAIEPITAVLAAVVLLTGCGPTANVPASSSMPSPTASSPVSSVPTTPAATTAKTVAAPAAPPATGPAQAPGGITVNPAGAVLPNHERTPGAVNPSVSQANIAQTICVSGWTATIRPPSSLTTSLKEEQLATGYTYKGDRATKD